VFVSYDVEGGESAACYLFGLWYEDGVQQGTTGEGEVVVGRARVDLDAVMPGLENEQALEGEWINAGDHIGCCDCGLVHQIEYRVKLPTGEVVIFPEGTTIQIRSFRDEEATKQARSSGTFICPLLNLKEEESV